MYCSVTNFTLVTGHGIHIFPLATGRHQGWSVWGLATYFTATICSHKQSLVTIQGKHTFSPHNQWHQLCNSFLQHRVKTFSETEWRWGRSELLLLAGNQSKGHELEHWGASTQEASHSLIMTLSLLVASKYSRLQLHGQPSNLFNRPVTSISGIPHCHWWVIVGNI